MQIQTVAMAVASALLVAGAGLNCHIKAELADEYNSQRDSFIQQINQENELSVKVISSSFNGNGVTERIAITHANDDTKSLPIILNHKVGFSLFSGEANGIMSLDDSEGFIKDLKEKHGVTLINKGEWSYNTAKKETAFNVMLDPSKFEKNGNVLDFDDFIFSGSSIDGSGDLSVSLENLILSSKGEGANIKLGSFKSDYTGSFNGYDAESLPSYKTELNKLSVEYSQLKASFDSMKTTFGMKAEGGIVDVFETVKIKNIQDFPVDKPSKSYGDLELDLALEQISESGLKKLLNPHGTETTQGLDEISLARPALKIHKLTVDGFDAKGVVELTPVRVSQARYITSVIPFLTADFSIVVDEKFSEQGQFTHQLDRLVTDEYATKAEGKYNIRFNFENNKALLNGKVLR